MRKHNYVLVGFVAFCLVWAYLALGQSQTPTVTNEGVSWFPWVNGTSFKLTDELWYGSYNRTGLVQYPEQAASYIIFKEGTIIYAKSGDTGQIDFSGENASEVIQAAIDALTDGGVIFIKSGDYSITNAIDVKENIYIIGEGTRATVLLQAYNGTVLKSDFVGRIIIKNLRILGDKTTYKSGSGIDIQSFFCLIENVEITNFYENGIRLHSDIPGNYANNGLITHCRITSCNRGVFFDTRASDNFLINNIIRNNTDAGVYLNAGGNMIYDNMISANRYGIYDVIARKTCIIRNWISNNQREAIFFNRGGLSYTNVIKHNFFDFPSQEGSGLYSVIKGVGASGYEFKKNIIAYNVFNENMTNAKFLIELEYESENIILGNIFRDSGVSGYISRVGSVGGTIIKDNVGFITENSGIATIPNGGISITVAHGLEGTPDVVVLGPTHAEVADAVWSANSTHITITVPSAVTADRDISWYAEYKP